MERVGVIRVDNHSQPVKFRLFRASIEWIIGIKRSHEVIQAIKVHWRADVALPIQNSWFITELNVYTLKSSARLDPESQFECGIYGILIWLKSFEFIFSLSWLVWDQIYMKAWTTTIISILMWRSFLLFIVHLDYQFFISITENGQNSSWHHVYLRLTTALMMLSIDRGI